MPPPAIAKKTIPNEMKMKCKVALATTMTFFFLGNLEKSFGAEWDAPQILAAVQGNFKGVLCIHAKAKITSVLSDEYVATGAPSENKTLIKDAEFFYNGEKWRVNLNAKRPSGETAFLLECAFDGEKNYAFEPSSKDGIMTINATRDWMDGWAHFSGVLFFPYAFLKKDADVTNGLITNLKTVAGENVNDGSLIGRLGQIEWDGKNPRFTVTNKDQKDTVTFSFKDGLYPISFQRIGKDRFGEVKCTFEASELSEVPVVETKSVVRFLKKGVIKLYRGDMLERTDTIEITQVEINNCDDSVFALDPTTAQGIYDADHNTSIQVPN